MGKVILPRLNQTGANEWADVQANDEAIATVINGELDNSNFAAGAVTETKVGDSAVTSRKLSPTTGSKAPSADLNVEVNEENKDIPGIEIVVTPAVASKLFIWVTLNLELNPSANMRFPLNVDGVDRGVLTEWHLVAPGTSANCTQQISFHDLIELTAAEHKIKVKARRSSAVLPSKVIAKSSLVSWMLVAS